MCFGAVGMLFVGYELIERFWLTELDPTVSHGLHLMLGVAAAAVSATLASFVLLCQVDACDPGIVPSRRMPGVAARIQGVSLRTKLVVPIVLLAVLPGIGIGFLTIGQFDRELNDVAQESLETSAAQVVRAISEFLELGLADAEALANTTPVRDVVGRTAISRDDVLDGAEAEVEGFLLDHASYVRARVLAPGGRELLRVERASASTEGGVLAPGWSDLTSNRPSTAAASAGFVTTTSQVPPSSDGPRSGSLHFVFPLSEGPSTVGSVVLDANASVLNSSFGLLAAGSVVTVSVGEGETLFAVGDQASATTTLADESRLSFEAPLTGPVEGVLSLTVPRRPPTGLASQLGAFISLVLFLVLAVAAIIGVLVAHYVTRPLKKLRVATMAIASGNLERRVEVSTGDEIEGLASDFNHMAERLSEANHRISHWNEELLEEVDKQTSALSQLQAGLARTDRLSCMGQVAASVMHEVGNPLAAIKTKIQVAEERGDLDGPANRVLDDILGEIDRLGGVLRSFSRLSRLRQPEFKPVSLAEVVSGVVSLVGPQVRKKGIALHVVVDEALDLIQADADQLRQLIINLVLNAADAVQSGGEIRIEARPESANETGAGRVSLEVIDDGVGIPESQLQQIWDAFYTTKDDGTGLGLAISRQIVEEHGGVLMIESREGEGTTVKATFPPSDRDQSEQAATDRMGG